MNLPQKCETVHLAVRTEYQRGVCAAASEQAAPGHQIGAISLGKSKQNLLELYLPANQ